nr:hypothetical protein Q903MT_gene2762 [Picea sitchensis]
MGTGIDVCMDHRWNVWIIDGMGTGIEWRQRARNEWNISTSKQASKPASTNGNTFPSPVEWRMGKSSPVG